MHMFRCAFVELAKGNHHLNPFDAIGMSRWQICESLPQTNTWTDAGAMRALGFGGSVKSFNFISGWFSPVIVQYFGDIPTCQQYLWWTKACTSWDENRHQEESIGVLIGIEDMHWFTIFPIRLRESQQAQPWNVAMYTLISLRLKFLNRGGFFGSLTCMPWILKTVWYHINHLLSNPKSRPIGWHLNNEQQKLLYLMWRHWIGGSFSFILASQGRVMCLAIVPVCFSWPVATFQVPVWDDNMN